MMILETFLAAVVLASAHLFGGHLRVRAIPRRAWLSAAGGVGVAYVFVHLLPEVAEGEAELSGWVEGPFPMVWLVALSGLVAFYGIEHLVRRPRPRAFLAEMPTFWSHIGIFSAYNILIGFLLPHWEEEEGIRGLVTYTIAMGLHFLVMDHALRRAHRRIYHRVGRWILAAALFGGWALGVVFHLPGPWEHALVAFLGGAIILNTLKEELPEEADGRFLPFLVGAAGYAALLHIA